MTCSPKTGPLIIGVLPEKAGGPHAWKQVYGRADHRGAARDRRRSFNGRSVPSPWDLTRDLLLSKDQPSWRKSDSEDRQSSCTRRPAWPRRNSLRQCSRVLSPTLCRRRVGLDRDDVVDDVGGIAAGDTLWVLGEVSLAGRAPLAAIADLCIVGLTHQGQAAARRRSAWMVWRVVDRFAKRLCDH